MNIINFAQIFLGKALIYSFQKKTGTCLLLLCLLFCGAGAFGQSSLSGGNPSAPNTIHNAPQRDTNANKSNNAKWKDEEAKLTYEKLNSARVYYPDTSLHTFHRVPFTQPWYTNLGNLGSPVNNLLFTPEDRMGPSLGYHVFDVYRFNVDSLPFYNTTRPYSIFNYLLGSKLEQTAGIMHTQAIKPNWNFAVEYHKTNSPGFFKVQRNNHDNAFLTTNYKSLDRHYTLYAAMVYNKQQHDENGGIVINDTTLISQQYGDRRTIDAAYQNSNYSISRSTVSNVQRDLTVLLQHSYTLGRTDTTYNADSTQYSYKLIPRFAITHKMEVSTEKHTYKDLSPDSLRYTTLFAQSFINKGSGYYLAGSDSVFTQQKWFWIDNKLLLNGFIGKEGHQLKFSAGIGNRYDQFISQPVSNLVRDSLPKQVYTLGLDRSSIVSNYIEGDLKKEALHPGEWEYGANTKLFITGHDAGNFLLNVLIGKEFKNSSFVAGFRQQVNSAPYSYTNYENKFTKLFFSFNDESVSQLYATLAISRWRISGGVRSYVIANYIYINESERPAQYTIPFTLNQAWLRKVFQMGDFFLDNELVYQQAPLNAPVNVPDLMGRHQFSYERAMFKRALKLNAGIEVRYNTAYHPSGYDALLNRFFYQNSTYINNAPVAAIFLNFRIKRFRAFIMGDQLQEIFTRNTILHTGTPVTNFQNPVTLTYGDHTPVYVAPDVLIRFGFTWALVN